MSISRKQREMLAFIEDFVEENKYPPTLEEIRNGLNISSKSLVNYHLSILEEAALLSRSPNKSRSIRLAGEADTVRVPFLEQNNLQAKPRAALKLDPDEVIELTSNIVPDRNDLFALRIEDNSMLDAFVNEGDVVILQRQRRARNGDMVAVHLNSENSIRLKRFYRENGHVRLQAIDPNSEDVTLDPSAVEVRGKVVAVIRQMDKARR